MPDYLANEGVNISPLETRYEIGDTIPETEIAPDTATVLLNQTAISEVTV